MVVVVTRLALSSDEHFPPPTSLTGRASFSKSPCVLSFSSFFIFFFVNTVLSMAGLAELLRIPTLVNTAGGEVSVASLSGKTVLLYFSASWCPPCRGFTPVLAEFYAKNKEAKNFEVIFLTWDEEEDDFQEYFNHMPWLAMPFSSQAERQRLTDLFGVESIPTVLTIDANSGKLIGKKARSLIPKDPNGEHFPYAD
jgi:nucleoredoxin